MRRAEHIQSELTAFKRTGFLSERLRETERKYETNHIQFNYAERRERLIGLHFRL